MSIEKPKALPTLEIQAIFREIRELIPMIDVLGKDLERAIHNANQAPHDAYLKRTVFRCFSAWVEGCLVLFRKAVLLLHDAFHVTFPEKKIARLSNDNLNSFKENFKLVLDSFARLSGGSFKVDRYDGAYHDFLSSIEVRNGLMHPKKASDLDITPKHISVAASGFKWYETKTKEMLVLMVHRFDASFPNLFTPEERHRFGIT